jgi:hypothetical protein
MLVVVSSYGSFNQRRYSNPWIALVSKETGKIDFSAKVGGYTGAYGKGDAGDLYIIDPQVGSVYAYGQKDYRGNNGGYQYVKYIGDGHFEDIEKTDLIKALNS